MSKILTLGKVPAANSLLVDPAGEPIAEKHVPVDEPVSLSNHFKAYSSHEEYRSQHLGRDGRRSIDLHALIDPKCKKCYGRGFTGYKLPVDKDERKTLDAKDRQPIFCPCLIKAFTKAVQAAKKEDSALVQVMR
jgi:hypothetical protein